MEAFDAYGHALAALALWALIVTVLAGLSTAGRGSSARCDCGKPRRDYDNPVYRRERAFMNAVETSGPFVAAAGAAVLAGGPAFWVNLLASVFIVARLGMAFVHIRTTNQPARSAFFALGLFCVLGLAFIAFFAAF